MASKSGSNVVASIAEAQRSKPRLAPRNHGSAHVIMRDVTGEGVQPVRCTEYGFVTAKEDICFLEQRFFLASLPETNISAITQTKQQVEAVGNFYTERSEMYTTIMSTVTAACLWLKNKDEKGQYDTCVDQAFHGTSLACRSGENRSGKCKNCSAPARSHIENEVEEFKNYPFLKLVLQLSLLFFRSIVTKVRNN